MCINPTLQRGITLIEQIMFIVIVSVGVIGLVSVMNPAIRASADPMVTKQLVSIAESLLNEVMHQPFTWCDPDDPAASTAQKYADCAHPQNTNTTVSSGGVESRYGVGPDSVFDNVSDYGNKSWNPIDDPSGSNAMAGYTASVAIASVGNAMGLADNTAALSVTVTVTNTTSSQSFSLTGYRFRYAPRT
jgi:MSHA pilin protein MshD